ncbi:MAG: hypothetical protein ACLP05_12185 [Candidatus Kryptoniota bacterium]
MELWIAILIAASALWYAIAIIRKRVSKYDVTSNSLPVNADDRAVCPDYYDDTYVRRPSSEWIVPLFIKFLQELIIKLFRVLPLNELMTIPEVGGFRLRRGTARHHGYHENLNRHHGHESIGVGPHHSRRHKRFSHKLESIGIQHEI